ncbi:MAG TPA: apolipoprotein N-acyltransferase [Vicinamibacteria bacterium]|nr:apolipoprotein N-acyltransferase [Vicinamibacteria bacterium]
MTRVGRPEGLAVLSGVLLVLSFPKFGHGAVAWVALAPLLIALARARSRAHGLRLGYLTGAVSALGLVYWTAWVVTQFGGLPLPLGIGVMVLLCLALALFPALFGWTMGVWVQALGARALLLAPLAWVASEILRAHTLFNFAWCLLGYSQQENLPVLQLARYAAVYGVSFLVAGVSAVLAYMAVEPRPAWRRRAALAAVVVLGGVWAHGYRLLRTPVPESGRLRVGLVQASILQEDKWEPGQAWRNVGRHLDLTRQAAAQGAQLVVWPESAVPFFFDRDEAVAGVLRRAAREHGVHLIFGNDDRDAGDDERRFRIWVGAKMLDPAGHVVLRYHKIRLVPFGEYVPVQSVLATVGVGKLVQRVGEFTPGEELATGSAAGHRLAVFICYEAIFPDLVRGFARKGADLLVNITNDGWYGRTSAPYQHMAMAVFRAVENGKYLLRAANTGITAVVDPRGRVRQATALFDRTVLVGEAGIVPGGTPYTRYGDVFAWACLGAAVALTAAILARPRS